MEARGFQGVEGRIYDGFEVLQAYCVVFNVDAGVNAEELGEWAVEYADRHGLNDFDSIDANEWGEIAVVPVEVDLMGKVRVDAIA
jgi:hypothetical protein